MTWRICIFLSVLALLAAGCTHRAGKGGKPVPFAYANIVSLSPSTSEFLGGAGGSPYLVGRTDECDRPTSVLKAREVVIKTKIDYDLILTLNPDLIMYDTMLYGEEETAKIEEFFGERNIETMPYAANTIKEYEDYGYRLAAKVHLETLMSLYLDKVVRQLGLAATGDTGDPRTAVLLGGEDGEYLAMGTEGLLAAVVAASGGTPVGPDGRLFQSIEIESLIEMDPEVVFSDGAGLEILSDPRLQELTAVKEGHVYDVDERTLIRIGTKMDSLVKDMHGMLMSKPVARVEDDAA
ncbi:MAG: ABC transporter substrate-binding protein [Armatimonadetes bacterium]|nr:ABC transporter substrate-binding protein [Armatimonadota bacterium]